MLNKVCLIGRLGRDPEVRYMPNGKAVCNFGLATSETWKDQSGAKQERTEWHNITMYERLAEIAGQYLKKGSLAYIEGRIQSRKYTDKMGVERTAYEIIASEMKMLDSKNSTASQGQGQSYPNSSSAYGASEPAYDDYGSSASSSYGASGTSAPSSPPPAAPQARSTPPIAPAKPVENIDDDIPF